LSASLSLESESAAIYLRRFETALATNSMSCTAATAAAAAAAAEAAAAEAGEAAEAAAAATAASSVNHPWDLTLTAAADDAAQRKCFLQLKPYQNVTNKLLRKMLIFRFST
jgi:invasion protein IalB